MSETAISELKRRYKNIYILYDTDKAGKEDSEKLQQQTGFTKINLPEFVEGKDVSDLYHFKGKKIFLETVLKLFRND